MVQHGACEPRILKLGCGLRMAHNIAGAGRIVLARRRRSQGLGFRRTGCAAQQRELATGSVECGIGLLRVGTESDRLSVASASSESPEAGFAYTQLSVASASSSSCNVKSATPRRQSLTVAFRRQRGLAPKPRGEMPQTAQLHGEAANLFAMSTLAALCEIEASDLMFHILESRTLTIKLQTTWEQCSIF